MLGFLKNKLKNNFMYKVENYYNTNFKSNVLISYITAPFKKGIKYSHSNYIEAIKIAEVFKELGYNVDIYDFRYTGFVDHKKYDIIFGIGSLFERLIKNRDNRRKYIFYATGAYFQWANYAEVRRISMLYERRRRIIEPKRLVKNPTYFATQLSDAIIITGNEWTVSTYIHSKMPIYTVPVSVYKIDYELNFDKRNVKNFIWFGSCGLIHKGLDLCLEVFKDLKDFNLYICGPKEDDFFEIYREELLLPNIYYEGFVDIRSNKFKEIVDKCMFSIFPSCSEGQSGSLLTTMSFGLIPISTKYSGVNIDDLGYKIDENIGDIKDKILKISKIGSSNLEKLAKKNMDFINNNHRIENFKQHMKNNLNLILGG